MAKTTQGKEQRFLSALLKGKTISRKQATSTYKIGNPSATVARLEQNHGVFITRTRGTDRQGKQFVKYSV
jgi:hypothetical protein